MVFPAVGSGPKSFRFFLWKPFGFAEESGVPGRCFRGPRRPPRAQSQLSSQKQMLKGKGSEEKMITTNKDEFVKSRNSI
jgi:hypothetical protein